MKLFMGLFNGNILFLKGNTFEQKQHHNSVLMTLNYNKYIQKKRNILLMVSNYFVKKISKVLFFLSFCNSLCFCYFTLFCFFIPITIEFFFFFARHLDFVGCFRSGLRSLPEMRCNSIKLIQKYRIHRYLSINQNFYHFGGQFCKS